VIEQRHSASAPSSGSNQAQDTFGRYRLLGLLGQGGMGRLYIAERRGVQGFVKIVALKRILPHLADSAALRDMFLNEARIAARLEHPNIVAAYELGEVDGKYFISMEYLPGEDLSVVISRCQGAQVIPVEIAAALAHQAAQGLHYAHDVRDGQGRLIGLVHRDVSPRNIFVTYHGVVKLLDFGMVRNPTGPASVPGVFKGKYAYCAPEQLDGGRLDRRTDVFCLGIVLWECLTGARLFDGATDVETIGAVRSGRIAAPSALRPEVPVELDRIALRALSRDPSHRYQSAQEMSEELDRFLLGRSNRPTTKTVGQWLESLFGPERAALKKSIGQGDNAEGAVQRLRALENAPRFDAPSAAAAATAGPTARERPRRSRPALLVGALLAVAALAGIGAVAMRAQRLPRAPGPTSGQTTASIELHSRPEGASIFVDGRPTGLRTPATLTGLPVGRTLRLRIDRSGYQAVSRETTPVSSEPQTISFTLEPVPPGRSEP
jgi:serine/threonine protein kinase